MPSTILYQLVDKKDWYIHILQTLAGTREGINNIHIYSHTILLTIKLCHKNLHSRTFI